MIIRFSFPTLLFAAGGMQGGLPAFGQADALERCPADGPVWQAGGARARLQSALPQLNGDGQDGSAEKAGFTGFIGGGQGAARRRRIFWRPIAQAGGTDLGTAIPRPAIRQQGDDSEFQVL